MKLVVCILLSILTSILHGQSTTIKNISETELNADVFIGVDSFKNIYYTKDNTLFINGSRGNYEYAALNLGEITSVDIINPLKITVFYKMSNTVVILDNTLAEIKRINFTNIPAYRNVTHARTANDRRLWIFNSDLLQLELFDYNQNKVITQFLPRADIPLAMTSNFNFCWLQMDSKLEHYNIYGALLDTQDIAPMTENMSQFNGKIVLLSENKLLILNTASSQFEALENLEIPVKQFSFTDEFLYIYDGQFLTTARLKPSQKN